MFKELVFWVFSDSIDEYRLKILNNEKKNIVLNNIVVWDKELTIEHPLKIVEKYLIEIRKIFLQDHIWNGSKLDYQKMNEDHRFCALNEGLAKFQVVDLTSLSEIEKKVFFLNVYNLLLLHGAITISGDIQSVLKRNQYFKELQYLIGGKLFSLDYILNDLFRTKTSSNCHLSYLQFKRKHQNDQFFNSKIELEIYFCFMTLHDISPIFKIYTVEDFENEIKETAKSYINEYVIINRNLKKITLPFFFCEFKSDLKIKNVNYETRLLSFIEGYFDDIDLKDYKMTFQPANYKINFEKYLSKSFNLNRVENKIQKRKNKRSQTILSQIKRNSVIFDELKSLSDFQNFKKKELLGLVYFIEFY